MGYTNGKQIVAQLSQFIGIKITSLIEAKMFINVNNCWNTKITFCLEHLVAKILICISIFLYFFYFILLLLLYILYYFLSPTRWRYQYQVKVVAFLNN
jgi:hypothetical protein